MTGVKEHLKWAGIGGSEEPTTPEVTIAGSKNEQTSFFSKRLVIQMSSFLWCIFISVFIMF